VWGTEAELDKSSGRALDGCWVRLQTAAEDVQGGLFIGPEGCAIAMTDAAHDVKSASAFPWLIPARGPVARTPVGYERLNPGGVGEARNTACRVVIGRRAPSGDRWCGGAVRNSPRLQSRHQSHGSQGIADQECSAASRS
jgi:hypothetical protein